MVFILTVLLCLGLTLDLRTAVLTGFLPNPVLRVQPDSVVSMQTRVTFFCEGTTEAKKYCIYKYGSREPRCTEMPPEPGNKAEFSIARVDQHHAGHYCCYYQTDDGVWSVNSDLLELVVTGAYSKPILSAEPSPVVTSGGKVTLQCASRQKYDRFILTKEGPQKVSRQDSQYSHVKKSQASFSVGPVTSNQRWTFRCYSSDRNSPQMWSEPSDPLELLFSGNLQKPIIKAEPSSVIACKSSITIWCQGTPDAEIYVIHKEGSTKLWGTQTPEEPGNKAKFSIHDVTAAHAGQYRCYSYSSAGWSERSDTLELVVTGIYSYAKPSLSALPSPLVTSGNMTLLCVSHNRYDKFILTKEDQKLSSSVDSKYIPSTEQYQATFFMKLMTPSHTGTFRCYGYYNNTPQLWSVPSEPLEIHISGAQGSSSGLRSHLTSLIGVSVAFFLLLIILLFLLLRRKHQRKFRKNGQAQLLLPRKKTIRLPEQDLQEETYAQVKTSRIRKERTPLTSAMSSECPNTKGGQAEEDREVQNQAAKSREPEVMTYAQLCIRTLSTGTDAASPSQAEEGPEKPSVYADLAAAHPEAVPKDKTQ